ncbi:MAG: glycosyltransferase [Clostridia bacterium]|nr:glycosyltransferase [Clostridia bacterium]
MKILHICCNLAGSSVFPQLFEALHDAGIEQEVFVPEKREEDLFKNAPEHVKTHAALTVKRTDALLFFRKAQRSVPEIMRRVDMRGVSLLHAHTLFTDGSIARRLGRQTGTPYVVTLRYSDIEAIWRYEPHLRPMARAILRDAKRVIFLGEAARKKVLFDWLGDEDRRHVGQKSAVIPNGIAPEWLTGAARAPLGGTVRVGFAGLLNRRKRPLDALAAVHLADEAKTGRRFVLRACGKGPLEEALRAGLREGDEYVGRVAGVEAMKRFYAGCDLLLVPSSAETFGMVYLEAMSQGVPVLYTRGQGFDGQFPEGEAGFSVACGDIREQARRLIDATQDYEARSERCVSLAEGYAWPHVAAKWAALYRSVR